MVLSNAWFDSVQPLLLECDGGGWLAVSPARSPLRIGVAGSSVAEARSRFSNELREWRGLLERTAPEPKNDGSSSG